MRNATFVALLIVMLLSVPAASAAPAVDGAAALDEQSQQARDPLDIALEHIRYSAAYYGLTAHDVADLIVTDQYVSKHTGVTHIYLRQRHEGIEVVGANININIMPDGSILSMNQDLIPNLASAIANKHSNLDAQSAVEAAAEDRQLDEPQDLEVVEEVGGEAQEVVLSEAGISLEQIPAKLVYQPLESGEVRLAWQIEIYETGAEHWWNLRVDAATGEVIGEDDYVSHFGDYTVFEAPKESPNDGDRTVASMPAKAALNASPFGWHDTDGVAGPEHTTTQGNNVHAYTDTDANNVPDPGSSPDGGAGLVFDPPLDLTLAPATYRDAAVTNLFYWNNIIHDVLYQFGFDEASGNFQVNNYGRGGLGGDAVQAEAQDGLGTDNANFATPPDGQAPRMQMFVWLAPTATSLTVNEPLVIAGEYTATGAAFGLQSFELTDDLVAVEDSGGISVTDACDPVVGFPAGSIALVDRGNCTFVLKAANVQAAGAVGIIVVNNVSGQPSPMGGTDASIIIPAMMISQADGALIRANLPAEVTMKSGPLGPDRDSDLDNGVIIHEYGHGVSNRLTGGPSNVSCLRNQEQMGEGWSDFLALALTTHPDDTATTPRGIATYSVFQGPTGNGIRPTPYTTDTAVNPTTYGNLPALAVPHGVGYAWTTMLWDMYWQLVDKHGYNPNLYLADMTAGNQLAIQLVMDGMKIQKCSPGFVDGRNAILQADIALTGGENQCEIWTAFANRGLGANASQGSAFSGNDGIPGADMPEACGGPPDTTDPSASVLIDGGAGFANTLDVLVSIRAEDVSGIDAYRLATSQEGLATAPFIPVDPAIVVFQATVPFTLTAGEGLKEVWLEVCDAAAADNCVQTSDTITLDFSVYINNGKIEVGDSGPGVPYPSTITVAGHPGLISNITVSLWNLSHTFVSELDILLVGPTGQTLVLMSDWGSSGQPQGIDLIFNDAGVDFTCGSVGISSGTYQPEDCTDSGDDAYEDPAPGGPYGTTFAPYLGTVPNGDWDLYVRDDSPGDGGQIMGGWSLQIETVLDGDSYQGCLYAGTFKQISLLPNGQSPTVGCARGVAISLYEGTDYWACLYAGSLTQVGTTQPSSCGRGQLIGFWAGTDIWACLYAGSLTQIGTTQPANCGRGEPIGFVQVH